jgi:hypothetical protein
VGLRPAGGVSQDHINTLKAWGVANPPVFRSKCPPGYTHCAGAFDKNKPEQVANQNLWFVDDHGHVCMPKCGWGTQPDLRIKDRIAQMVRNKEIDKDKATPDKIRQITSGMLCDPCTPGKGSVSRASCALTTTLRELDETDKLVQAQKLAGGFLSGGADLGLSGGAKLSARSKCDLESMVRGMDKGKRDRLKDECEQITADYKKKVTKKHIAMLQCKARKYEDDVPPAKYAQVRNHIPAFVESALNCAEYNGLNVLPGDCVRTSCFSGRAQPTSVAVVKVTHKKVKILKRMYHGLMDIYTQLRRKARGCCPLSLHDKMKLQCKVQQIYFKAAHAEHRLKQAVDGTGAGPNLDSKREDADGMWAQMQECAALCGKDDTGCGTGNCVPSMYCESGVCVPKALDEMRKEIKKIEKITPVTREYVDYMNKVVSQHRRLSLV